MLKFANRFALRKLFRNRFSAKHQPANVLLLLSLFVLTVTIETGCSRRFWRQHADKDAYQLLAEKQNDDAWLVPRLDITPDTRSRFHDPYDPDKGPLPLDDSAAGEYMLQVAGKRGYKSWHKFGRSMSIENPHWLEQFGLTPEKTEQATAAKKTNSVQHANFETEETTESTTNTEFSTTAAATEPSSRSSLPKLNNLTLPQVLELSTIHSRDYQNQIESVYLRSLELSFERFQFDVRFLGTSGSRPTANGTHSSVPGRSNNFGLNTIGGIRKLLPSGGQWAVELANQTLWMFSGPDRISTASSISYSLVQPLLFQAGRKIALENLTQSERDLLYTTRDLARFRKELFTDVVSGGSGYLSVLQQQQVVLNERDNIRRVLEQFELLKTLSSQHIVEYRESLNALPAGIAFPPTVLGQIRYDATTQQIFWRGRMSPNQLRTLLQLNKMPAYQKAIRNLSQRRVYEPLTTLPANIVIPPSLQKLLIFNAAEKRLYWYGPLSEQQQKLLFSLSNDAAWKTAINGLSKRLRAETLTQDMLQLKSRLLRSQNRLRAVEQALQDRLDQLKLQLGLPPNMPMSLDMSMLKPFQLIDPKLFQVEQALKQFVLEWAKLDENRPDAKQLQTVINGLTRLQKRVDNDVLGLIQSDLAATKTELQKRFSQKQFAQNAPSTEQQRVQNDLARDERLLRDLRKSFAALSETLKKLPTLEKKLAAHTIAVLREKLLKITQNAQVIQIGIRVERITLERFTLSLQETQQKALMTRLDLKNARARVMDARRAVEIAANRLEAVLNIRAEGEVRTRNGNKPLDFRGQQSNFRVGIGFTAPLDQINARNAYRSAQIAYQRARRDYMATEDRIKLAVRQSWRNLDALKKNFETARQSVRFSAMEFDSAVDQAAAPGQPINRNSGLTLLNALNSVLSAQNGLIQIWTNYERSRLNIHRDMGMMEIDARGIWNDDYYQQRLPTLHVLPAHQTSTVTKGRSFHEIHGITAAQFEHLNRGRTISTRAATTRAATNRITTNRNTTKQAAFHREMGITNNRNRKTKPLER